MSQLISRIYLFLLSVIFISGLHADYLLLEHRDDGSLMPVTARTERSEDLFRVVLKYQFPANTNPVLGITPDERELLDANEQAFIQYQIQKINSAVDAVFVPSVLYELFLIARYLHETPRDAAMRNIVEFLETTLMKFSSHGLISISPEDTERICAEIQTIISRQPAEAQLAAIETELMAVIRRFFVGTQTESLCWAGRTTVTSLLAAFTSQFGSLDPIFSTMPEKVLPRVGEINAMDELYAAIAHTAEIVLPVYQASNQLLGNWLHDQSLLTTELNSNGNTQLPISNAQKALHSLARTIPILFKSISSFRRFYPHHCLPEQLIRYLGMPSLQEGTTTRTSRPPVLRGMGHIMKESLRIEYEAHQRGKSVIYRGTNSITVQEKPYLELPLRFDGEFSSADLFQRVSFGNSLLSGIFCDPGANAFDFIGHRSIGYALFIDKKQYAADFSHNTHIVIMPPYPSLVTLFWGQGESFHPVTRSWKDRRHHCFEGYSTNVASNKKLSHWFNSDLTLGEYIVKFAWLFGARDTVVFLKSHVDGTSEKHRDQELEYQLLENTRSLTVETLLPG